MLKNQFYGKIFRKSLSVMAIITAIGLIGCGQSQQGQSKGEPGGDKTLQGAGKGAINISVLWLGKASSSAKSVSPLDCRAAKVSKAEAAVYDSADKLVVSTAPWLCDVKTGSITNVPAGNNYTVVVLGRDSGGKVLYRADMRGVNVEADKTRDAGALTASSFIPTHLGPPNNAKGNIGYISVVWSATGASYKVQLSKDASFAKPEIDAIANTTMYTPVNVPSGSYHWRVAAVDSHGNTSDWSSPQVIGLNAGK